MLLISKEATIAFSLTIYSRFHIKKLHIAIPSLPVAYSPACALQGIKYAPKLLYTGANAERSVSAELSGRNLV